jgi:glutaconyl-CoA/methylmalonyl-CoA decarboxylase subunit gamma
VMVMEAMKMENEIRATADGEVSNICVAEGQAVETGTLLMELKPAEEGS